MARRSRAPKRDWIEEIVETRGAQERRFWEQAAALKKRVAAARPASLLDRRRLRKAKKALEDANEVYLLMGDLTGALEKQATALASLSRISKRP